MSGPQDQRAGSPSQARGSHRLQIVGNDGVIAGRRSISVLYVEDDDEDVFLLRRQIHSLPSFDVAFAHADSVEAARSMTEQHRFDLVLCDFWLGRETTIPLIDELKLAAEPCPVVLVSSLENDDIELIGRRAGAAGFVAKADLSAAALDRIFVTLLPPDESAETRAPAGGGVATWLRALMRSIDVVQASGARLPRGGEADLAEAVVSEIVGGSEALRQEMMETLAGLERATRLGAWTMTRFDAVPYLTDGVERLRGTLGPDAVSFLAPAMPIMVEASPTLFGDLVQGFFAEAADLGGERITVSPSVRDGYLRIQFETGTAPASGRAPQPAVEDAEAARAAAAADARRFLVETLARAVGGNFEWADRDPQEPGFVCRLDVPLRNGD